LDDARYCLALAQSAAAAGATVVNHVKVIDFQKDTNGLLVAAQVLEEVQNKQFAVKARYFLNCTGPFSDTIRLMANPALSRRIRHSKGVHLTLPGSLWNSLDALLIPQTKDGRVVFAIPFEGQLILGTTDTAFNVDDAEPVLESTEVAFLLETLQPYLDQAIQPHQITAGFGGVRPLVVATPKEPNTAPSETKSLLRDHIVEHDHVSGLFSLLGGKWTTYRLMAKDAIDAVFRQQKRLAPCSTDHHALVGASGFHQHLWRELAMAAHLPENVARHLASKYGGNAFQIIQILKEDPTLSQVVHPNWPFIEAEICYSVRAEMTCTLRDLMARRWRLEVLDWQAALAVAPLVASRMAKELSWDPTTTQKALNEYQNQLQFWIEQSQK
jgi:glycerol-3-phosphate dehydrogenase